MSYYKFVNIVYLRGKISEDLLSFLILYKPRENLHTVTKQSGPGAVLEMASLHGGINLMMKRDMSMFVLFIRTKLFAQAFLMLLMPYLVTGCHAYW